MFPHSSVLEETEHDFTLTGHFTLKCRKKQCTIILHKCHKIHFIRSYSPEKFTFNGSKNVKWYNHQVKTILSIHTKYMWMCKSSLYDNIYIQKNIYNKNILKKLHFFVVVGHANWLISYTFFDFFKVYFQNRHIEVITITF